MSFGGARLIISREQQPDALISFCLVGSVSLSLSKKKEKQQHSENPNQKIINKTVKPNTEKKLKHPTSFKASKTQKQQTEQMANLLYYVAILLIWATLSVMASSSTIDANGDLTWIPTSSSGLVSDVGNEFELDSEINRRILATSKYISYGALQRNTVPCSRRGASYYNCKPGAQANPYSRGCSAITRCRS